MLTIKIAYRMSQWNGALNVEYQNSIAHTRTGILA